MFDIRMMDLESLKKIKNGGMYKSKFVFLKCYARFKFVN